jgi:hypothetical protein
MRTPPAGLIDILRSFNRKERFYLVGAALGNPAFRLSRDFIDKLNRALNVDVPADAFCAMDYHLDWLYASLVLASGGQPDGLRPNIDRLVKGTQEDIDLLVAYETADDCHILLLEAKGVTGWTNKQMKHKADRLGTIFGADGAPLDGVVPHFAMLSPNRPKRLKEAKWPDWMRPGGSAVWIELPIPPGLRKVTRCDDQGRPSWQGTSWRVTPDRY